MIRDSWTRRFIQAHEGLNKEHLLTSSENLVVTGYQSSSFYSLLYVKLLRFYFLKREVFFFCWIIEILFLKRKYDAWVFFKKSFFFFLCFQLSFFKFILKKIRILFCLHCLANEQIILRTNLTSRHMYLLPSWSKIQLG